MRRAPLFRTLVCALALTGCDSRSGDGDAGPGGPDVIPSDATSVGACDPVQQDCPAGQTCDLVCDGTVARIACRPVPSGGGLAPGSSCKETQECGASAGCYESAHTPSSCIRYCSTDADCNQGTCQTRTVLRNCGVNPHFTVKFCLP